MLSHYCRKNLRILLAVSLCALTSCSSWYYSALEAVGTTKRDLFKSRVVAARDAQVEAKDQFSSALEQFKALRDFEGGKLEETYERLDEEFKASEKRAERVRSRIDAVESVSAALFDEWEDEIEEYSSDALRRSSKKKLSQAKQQYERLMRSMRAAEERLEPALAPMRDQVLFLKHNLNAKAIASLEGELKEVEFDVSTLLRDLERSIAETDRFIKTLDS